MSTETKRLSAAKRHFLKVLAEFEPPKGERWRRASSRHTVGMTVAVLTSLVASHFQISGIREDTREIRSDMKLLTGKVYEWKAKESD